MQITVKTARPIRKIVKPFDPGIIASLPESHNPTHMQTQRIGSNKPMRTKISIIFAKMRIIVLNTNTTVFTHNEITDKIQPIVI